MLSMLRNSRRPVESKGRWIEVRDSRLVMLEMPNRISFEKPPVVETLLEIEFAAVPGWGVQYLGLFWADIRDRFPRFEQQPAVLTPSPIVQFNIMSMPIRGWFIDPTDTRVVQVQHDRFSYNWRERPSHDRYPNYEILQPEFQREWETFQRFLSRAGLPIPRITVARVVYVNHIPHGQGWKPHATWEKLFAFGTRSEYQSACKTSNLLRSAWRPHSRVGMRCALTLTPGFELSTTSTSCSLQLLCPSVFVMILAMLSRGLIRRRVNLCSPLSTLPRKISSRVFG